MLQVSVTHYDDVISPQGECVTMYMVQAQYSNRSAYCIAKRYSDFANLYQIVKDIVPYDYKFPNKSMFNNSAQFTKDRRRKGFDELLKLLARYDPLPEELQSFLELRERVTGVGWGENQRRSVTGSMPAKSSSAPSSGASTKQPTQSNTKTSTTSSSLASTNAAGNGLGGNPSEQQAIEETAARKKLVILSNYLIKFRTLQPNEEETDVDVFYEIKKLFPSLLRSSFRIAALAYIVLILLGIVDISSNSYFRIVYTFIALVSLGCFVQIRDAKKSMIKSS
jgi:hypothetical protein